MSGSPNDPNQQTPPWGATPPNPYAAQPNYGRPLDSAQGRAQYPNAAQGFGYSQNSPPQPQYGYAPPPGYPMYPMPGYVPAKPRSGRAIASLVLGVSNIVLGITAVIGAPVGLILGVMALKDTGPMGTRQGRGLAIGGIALNAFGLLIVAGLILIFAAAIYTADANKGVRNAAVVDQDMYVIGDKLRTYYYANKQSLGPGGPVQSTNGYRGPKVVGTLDLPDLVDDYDLTGNVADFTLTITGKKSATVHHIRTGRELRITDISTRSETIYMGP
jgi:hypothetical protein